LSREVERLEGIASDGGVRLVLENCLRSDFFSNADRLFKVLRASGAGFCLDVAHAELTAQKAKLLRRKPDEVHLTDTLVESHADLHAGLGQGDIDFAWWVRAFKRLGFDGLFVLECERKSDFVASREKLLRLWNK
ncbi:MAG: TIM barrel protein, partial [Candidatus Micrarchaeota archaeon]